MKNIKITSLLLASIGSLVFAIAPAFAIDQGIVRQLASMQMDPATYSYLNGKVRPAGFYLLGCNIQFRSNYNFQTGVAEKARWAAEFGDYISNGRTTGYGSYFLSARNLATGGMPVLSDVVDIKGHVTNRIQDPRRAEIQVPLDDSYPSYSTIRDWADRWWSANSEKYRQESVGFLGMFNDKEDWLRESILDGAQLYLRFQELVPPDGRVGNRERSYYNALFLDALVNQKQSFTD